ncbi:hypothetical protein OJ997_13490 [Solirubrobacter phytolaccae]|uniref:Uncharacterized protein n=1 Tax=Solirubrobacter phytolaccae TaxID=1404360 RepID=A0A9X3NA87_9ACTN|nr:hypothetical protein [Solirubrobacter phytolaccae]MDA0181314.1 hypothetical protein [Solirubrobacter phytolaccae]
MKSFAIGLMVAALAACATVAHAGVYDVRLCASGAADPAWVSQSTASSLSATRQCQAQANAQISGFAVRDRSGVPTTAAGGEATWSLRPPAGATIRALSLQRFLGNRSGWEAAIVTAEGTALETCPIVSGFVCSRGAAAGGANSVTFGSLATSGITFRLKCVAGSSCINGSDDPRGWVAVYGGTARVEDPALPVIGAFSGTFGDAGWHKGSDTVGVSATDASGVKQLRIVVRGIELGRKDGACDYTRMQPCPSALDGTFSFDTSRVVDGTHELQAIAADASDQTAVVTGTLRVDRNAPLAPKDLSVTAADDGSYDVKWVNPDQGTASPIVAARYAICDPAPGLTCQPAQRVAGPGIAKLSGVTVTGKGTFRLWLEDEAGNVDPGNSSVAPVDPGLRTNPRVLDTNPPILLPSGPTPASKLKIGKARRSGSTLTLSGTIARGASARISAQLARSKSGKAIASGRTSPRTGKWTIKVKLSSTLRRAGAIYLTLTFAGQDNFRKTTIKRKLSRRSTSGGSSTANEFSVETGR